MGQNVSGAFVIPWTQTELDGRAGALLSCLVPGCSWRTFGEFTRVDGPADILPLVHALDGDTIRYRVGRRRCAPDQLARYRGDETDPLLNDGFVLTDGVRQWHVAIISAPSGALLCLFDDIPPVPGKTCWVVSVDWLNPAHYVRPAPVKGVICFTPGTMLATPTGALPVEALREGDLIQTKDSGPQPVLWTGQRNLGRADLMAAPHLTPVKVCQGALDGRVPDGELLVSPDHRLVLRGARALALFNCDEVLVAAKDLVNDHNVLTAYDARSVSYIHIALPSHQVVFANGVEAESFHPMSAGLGSLADADRRRLMAQVPALACGEHAYGDYARRVLSPGEAVILRGDAGWRA